MIMLIVDVLASVIVAGSVVTAGVLVRKYVKGVTKTSQELRSQIKMLNLKIEGQLKPQIEQHHAALRAVDSNMHTLIEALDK